MKYLASIAVVLLSFLSAGANAAVYRLDFDGQIRGEIPYDGNPLAGSFSATFFLDDTAADIRPEPNSALYEFSLVSGSVTWDGVDYTRSVGAFNDVWVRNDSGGVFADFFGVVGTFLDSQGGTTIFGLQLRDSTESVFSSDAFPESLDLSSFDAFDIMDANGSGFIFSPFDGTSFLAFAELESLSYRPVPLPAGVWLLISALAFAGIARHRG